MRGIEVDWVDQIGSNINCLIFRENKFSSKNFKEKNYILYYNTKKLFVPTHCVDLQLVIIKVSLTLKIKEVRTMLHLINRVVV